MNITTNCHIQTFRLMCPPAFFRCFLCRLTSSTRNTWKRSMIKYVAYYIQTRERKREKEGEKSFFWMPMTEENTLSLFVCLFVWVLWHINLCWLYNAKYIFIQKTVIFQTIKFEISTQFKSQNIPISSNSV